MNVFFKFALLASAAALASWAKLRLINRYRVDEYLNPGEPRRLYWIARIASLLVGIAILLLAYATKLWWVVTPAWLFTAYIVGVNAWALRMRFSGAYAEYYRARRWQ